MIHATELAVRSYFFIGVSTFAFISGYYGVKWNAGKFLKYESMTVVCVCVGGGCCLLLTFLLSDKYSLNQ